MAKLKINAVAISGARGFATTAKTTTGSVADGVAAIQSGMQAEIAARNNISYRLSSIHSSIVQIENDIQAIYQTTDIAVAKYNNAERQIVGWAQQVANGYRPHNYSSNRGAFAAAKFDKLTRKAMIEEKIANQGMKSSEKEKFDWKTGDLFWDVIGEGGSSGKVAGTVASMINAFNPNREDGDMEKALIGVGSTFVSSFGDLAETAFSNSSTKDMKKFFFGDWEKGSALDDLTEILDRNPKSKTKVAAVVKDEYVSYTFKNADTVGDKIKVGTKWAGTIFSAGMNAVDNYNEYKNEGGFENTRFWTETVTETAVDIAVDAVATGIASVAVTAVLGASAPAVAVGVAAVGIAWAADTATRYLTSTYGEEEKGLTEFISDGILDIGESVVDFGKNLFGGNANNAESVGINWGACFG